MIINQVYGAVQECARSVPEPRGPRCQPHRRLAPAEPRRPVWCESLGTGRKPSGDTRPHIPRAPGARTRAGRGASESWAAAVLARRASGSGATAGGELGPRSGARSGPEKAGPAPARPPPRSPPRHPVGKNSRARAGLGNCNGSHMLARCARERPPGMRSAGGVSPAPAAQAPPPQGPGRRCVLTPQFTFLGF